jgi:predicted phage terminase large subunit-like protein
MNKEWLRQELKKELVRKEYASYCKYVHQGNWILGKHLEIVCKAIEQIINREIKENILIVSMPPQHGKSQCVTETLPSYYLGKFPNRRVIEVSYGDDLARRFGRRNKQKIEEYGEDLFGIKLSKNNHSDTEFEIEKTRGSMISRGIMAGITGQPADLVIIDDPVKNRQEAESITYQERIWDEFLNSILTRLSANGVIILIMTRWHENDLAGQIMANMHGKYREINIPLEAELNDILGRSEGDSLFPEIGKDNEWLQEFKRNYMTTEGIRAWNALMQGRPTSLEGNVIKRKHWKYYDRKPIRFDQVIQSWDCTFKDTSKSDYVVGTVWGRIGADKYLLDLKRDRLNLVATINAIKVMSSKWKSDFILVEDKANGSAVIEMLKHSISGIIAVNPRGSKEARVQAILPHIESGNVYLPSNEPFTNDFIEECSSFPNGKHDDQVDSMSQALIRLINDFSTYKEPIKKEHDPLDRQKYNQIMNYNDNNGVIEW